MQVKWVVGVDEVGRGCLAGPVYAAAVAFKILEDFSQYKDSKLLSATRREFLSEHIQKTHLSAVASASVKEIDSINILKASLLAMKRSIEALPLPQGWLDDAIILVDGSFIIPNLSVRKQIPLVKGDQRSPQIAAASILAKVTRDALMQTTLATSYPNYGFEKHKAYATKEHLQAIEKWGPCPQHRTSFSPVKQILQGL